MADSIRNILLISPHKVSLKGYQEDLSPPLGLAYIAAVLEAQGYHVRILDIAAEGFGNEETLDRGFVRIGLPDETVERRIREAAPDVVGVSCLMSSQFKEVSRLFAMIKKINPAIITLSGGGHPSALPEQSLAQESVDYVILGEGEDTVRDLLGCLASGGDVSTIDGLGYKRGQEIIIHPKTRFIEDLDALPLPARHLLPMDIYLKTDLPQAGTSLRSPSTSMLTSRGCSAKCIFCATTKFWGNRHRTRSVGKVLDEIKHLVQVYGIREISFIDDNLTLDKKRAMEIFSGIIDLKLDLVWNTPQGLALWSMDEELLVRMKESGCYEVTFAIESGDPDVLNRIIRKPLKLEKVEPLVRAARKLGMLTKGYFVVGLPGETKQQMQRTFDFVRELKLDAAGIFIATPLPGTELYRICLEKKYLTESFSFENIIYSKGNIQTPEFNANEVERLVSRNLLIINIGLLIRNPFKFFRKYFRLLTRNPKSLFRHALFLARKSR